MATLVVNMATDPDRQADVANYLRNDITGWARQQPGFLRGEWLISDDLDSGLGLVVFDSADAATRAAVGPAATSTTASGRGTSPLSRSMSPSHPPPSELISQPYHPQHGGHEPLVSVGGASNTNADPLLRPTGTRV